MQLEWTQFAQADREAIFDYIEADSPQAAITVDDRIRQQVEELRKFPKIGRPGRIDGTRELI
ncbi:MAG TPA: type II toxin-antitoxin system RelE/ParE family toxin, partial [Terriglobales bacterium]|nr:type II toxin-antitoxin system RelE/ParE family toxin [Terriglobales bacterium]